MAKINSGLGWVCDESAYVETQGTYLGENNYGVYTKQYAGPAIAVWNQRAVNNGLPFLMSTVKEYAELDPGSFISSANVDGVIWFVGSGAGEQGAGVNAGFPIILSPRGASLEQIIRDIIDAAGVDTFIAGLISRLAIKLDFPNAGDPLASTGSADTDVDVPVSVTSIVWDPADSDAEQLTSYKATVTLTADGGRFNSGIEPVIIDTSENDSTYVQGVSRPIFDPETPNAITYTITFGPTGIKDPYAVVRDEESDQVPDPALPALAATSTGFLAIYQPTLSQLKQLATYMWSDSFIDTLKKLVSDPFQTILGLSIVPVQAPSGGSSNVILGNVDTGISMSKVATQYVTVNCGTLTLEEKYRSYLDYNPNTKTWIYLPYIGIQAIDVDTIMNTSIEVIYKVDVLSGACLCNVLANGTVIGSYAGACASQLPITSMQFSSALTGLAQLTGGLVSVTVGSATGNIAASIVGGINAVQGTANIMKSNIEKSNRLGSTAGLMAVQYPYLIIQRPRQALPNAQNHYTGYPSFQTFTIGNLRGYTEIANIDLSGITATQKELDELKAMLSEGVYF